MNASYGVELYRLGQRLWFREQEIGIGQLVENDWWTIVVVQRPGSSEMYVEKRPRGAPHDTPDVARYTMPSLSGSLFLSREDKDPNDGTTSPVPGLFVANIVLQALGLKDVAVSAASGDKTSIVSHRRSDGSEWIKEVMVPNTASAESIRDEICKRALGFLPDWEFIEILQSGSKEAALGWVKRTYAICRWRSTGGDDSTDPARHITHISVMRQSSIFGERLVDPQCWPVPLARFPERFNWEVQPLFCLARRHGGSVGRFLWHKLSPESKELIEYLETPNTPATMTRAAESGAAFACKHLHVAGLLVGGRDLRFKWCSRDRHPEQPSWIEEWCSMYPWSSRGIAADKFEGVHAAELIPLLHAKFGRSFLSHLTARVPIFRAPAFHPVCSGFYTVPETSERPSLLFCRGEEEWEPFGRSADYLTLSLPDRAREIAENAVWLAGGVPQGDLAAFIADSRVIGIFAESGIAVTTQHQIDRPCKDPGKVVLVYLPVEGSKIELSFVLEEQLPRSGNDFILPRPVCVTLVRKDGRLVIEKGRMTTPCVVAEGPKHYTPLVFYA